jgi:hypothetical protein
MPHCSMHSARSWALSRFGTMYISHPPALDRYTLRLVVGQVTCSNIMSTLHGSASSPSREL